MTLVHRNLHLRGAVGVIRTATYQNREHLVVPVVALVEGVIHPVNAKGPELVLAEEFSIAPSGWNGRPVFPGHPMRNGTQVSANTPEILESESMGSVFNAAIVNDRLTMEAWLDPARAELVGAHAVDIVNRARKGEMIEISVGVLVLGESKLGVYKGKRYTEIWRNITPDHLALLPEGDIGACSLTMGCGVRAASVHLVTAKGFEMEDNKPKKTIRERLIALTQAWVRASGTPQEEAAEEAAELIQWTTMDAMLDQAAASVAEAKKITGQLISDETDDATETADEEDAEETVENARLDSLYSFAGSAIDSLYKVLSIVYDGLADDAADAMSDSPRYAKGARHSKIDQKSIQAVHDNSVSLGASCEEMKAASDGCGCGNSKQGDSDMTREERIRALMSNEHNPLKDEAALKASSDAGLASLEAHCAAEATKKTSPAATTDAAALAAAAAAATTPKAKTAAEWFAEAPSEVRAMASRYQAADTARRTELVNLLKTAQTEYKEDELKEMDVPSLERIMRLAKVSLTPEPTDFSAIGFGRPRDAADNDAAPPAPPVLNDRIRAAAAKQRETTAV